MGISCEKWIEKAAASSLLHATAESGELSNGSIAKLKKNRARFWKIFFLSLFGRHSAVRLLRC
jgi:hypothetical protein